MRGGGRKGQNRTELLSSSDNSAAQTGGQGGGRKGPPPIGWSSCPPVLQEPFPSGNREFTEQYAHAREDGENALCPSCSPRSSGIGERVGGRGAPQKGGRPVLHGTEAARLLLTPEQRRFLCFFLIGDPALIRAVWLGEGGRVLAAVVDVASPPAPALRVKVYRLSDGGVSFKGALDTYRILELSHLAPLAPYWAEPLRKLNTPGEVLARALEADAAEPAVTDTFKTADRASPEAFKWAPVHSAWLDAQARAEGRPKTAIILQALADYRRRIEGGHP